jgi:alpha-tubulin suppressor-like RCC1 family protein
LLNFVECLTELNIASKKVQSVIIWGFVDFGNVLLKMTYLPTNFEMELTLLSEMY